MRLKIVRAENLPASDATGRSDPFVKVFYDGKEVGATPRVKRTLNPRWDFELALPALADTGPLYVVLEVWDRDELSSNDLLGALRVPFPDWHATVADLQHKQEQQQQQQQRRWQQQQQQKNRSKVVSSRQLHAHNTVDLGELGPGRSHESVPTRSRSVSSARDAHAMQFQDADRASLSSTVAEMGDTSNGSSPTGLLGIPREEDDDDDDHYTGARNITSPPTAGSSAPQTIKPVLVWCKLVKGSIAQGRLLCAVQYEPRDFATLSKSQPYGTNVQEVFLPQNPRFAHTYGRLPRSWHPDLGVRREELAALRAGAPKDCLFPWNEKLLYMVEEVTVTFHVNESNNQGVLATLVLTNYRIWFVPYRRVLRGLLHEDVHTLPIGKVLKASIVQQKRSNNNAVTVLVLDNMDAGHYHVTLSPIARLRESAAHAKDAEAKRIKQVHNIVAEIEWLRIENSFCAPTDLNHSIVSADEEQLERDLRLYTPKHGEQAAALSSGSFSGTGGTGNGYIRVGPSSPPQPILARSMTTPTIGSSKENSKASLRHQASALPSTLTPAVDSSSLTQSKPPRDAFQHQHHRHMAGKRRIRYDAEAEFRRQGAWHHPRWRYCSLNEEYELCASYPSFLMVPAGLSNDTIAEAARYRSKNRFPALSWIHPRTGAPLCRSSQPNTGVLRSANSFDRELIWAIRDAAVPAEVALRSMASSSGSGALHPSLSAISSQSASYSGLSSSFVSTSSASMVTGSTITMSGVSSSGSSSSGGGGRRMAVPKKSRLVHIVDARPEINAKSNALAGKGHESVKQYDRDGVPTAAITFMGIDNIHVVRGSLAGLAQALYEVDDSNFFGAVQKSRWLEHICSVLQGASEVATHLERGDAVLVHCSDGWDRTAQLSALPQLMLDPYYRTLEGFAILIEKDWCSFGHMFQKRCGHPTSDQTSPIFLQFIDAVYQLTLQFPTHFQFNELFLSTVAEAVYSSWYGTFQKNSERERRAFLANTPSVSLWDVIRASTDEFLNPLFAGGSEPNNAGNTLVSSSIPSLGPMLPVCRVRVMQLWVSQYQKAIGHMRLQQREFEMLQLIRQQETELSRMYALLSGNQLLELRAAQMRSEIASLARSMNLDYPDIGGRPSTPSSTNSKNENKRRARKKRASINEEDGGDEDGDDSFHGRGSGGGSRSRVGNRVPAASVDFHDLVSLSAGSPGLLDGKSSGSERMTLAQVLQRANEMEAAAAAATAASAPPQQQQQQQPPSGQNVPNPRRRRSLTSRSRSNSLRVKTAAIVSAMTLMGSHDRDGSDREQAARGSNSSAGANTNCPTTVGADGNATGTDASTTVARSLVSPHRSGRKHQHHQQQQQPSSYQQQHDELKSQLRELESQLGKLNHQIAIKEDSAKQILRRFRCYNYNLPESVLMNDPDVPSPSNTRSFRATANTSSNNGGSSGGDNGNGSSTLGSIANAMVSGFRQSGSGRNDRFNPSASAHSLESSSSSPGSSPSSTSDAAASRDKFTPGSAPLLTTNQVISSANYLNAQPVWERDEDAPCCKRCKKKFKALIRNRHHCRCCGYVFCGRCTSHRMSLPDFGYYDVVRVCKVCYHSGEDG